MSLLGHCYLLVKTGIVLILSELFFLSESGTLGGVPVREPLLGGFGYVPVLGSTLLLSSNWCRRLATLLFLASSLPEENLSCKPEILSICVLHTQLAGWVLREVFL